jgi:probable 2-oxoglutarate dehydrogenase E1 component DHKTD1
MPHRGRLNLLVDIFKVNPAVIFSKVQGNPEFPEEIRGSGDVLSHLFASVDLNDGKSGLHLSMLPNPSHLEAINPVVAGKARGKQIHYINENSYENCKLGDKVLAVQLHGDAAFAGQGVVMETLALSNLPHFTCGGSVHLIVNNQIGYTTTSFNSRSTQYSSDVGKMIDCPIIHVNGESPEDIIRVAELAFAYRQQFRKDVIVDLCGYRKWGHNEVDEPSFTHPLMYKIIRSRDSTPVHFEKQLIQEGVITENDINSFKTEYFSFLDKSLKDAKDFKPALDMLKGKWKDLRQETINPGESSVQTGISKTALVEIGNASVAIPSEFNLHPRLQKFHVEARQNDIKSSKIDWATAESMAFGSLLKEKFHIRISGQDVGRGTFSQRHVMVVDQGKGQIHVPLNNMGGQQGHLEIANSNLSEFAVMGFEYGLSIENPNTLYLWEAQFGDFFNGAQIIIDTFLTGSESKWLRQTGLVLLLPHGYDGAGPEHSSCRIERFLQLTDETFDLNVSKPVNMSVVYPTLPSQYFHLLRRQMKRDFRKPLVVVGPKTLLRLPVTL